MNVQDRIRKAHIAIMNHRATFCRFAGILGCGQVIVTDEVPTAATNGWDVKYNPKFVETHAKADTHLRFLVLHEAMHKAYRHLFTWRGLHEQDARLANIAADHFVNLSLVDADAGEGFIKMLDVGIKPDPKYRGWSVKQIFDDLMQSGQDDDQGDGMDDHDWDGANDGTEAEALAKQGELDRAMRQGEALHKSLSKNGTGGANGIFGDLLAPKIDWKKALREFITDMCAGRDEYTWRRPNRRFLAQDLLMPSMYGTTVTELVIGFDTSGSVFNSPEMDRFVAELTQIVEAVTPTKVHVVYWDTSVTGHQTFDEGQFAVHNLRAVGGGGTDGSVLFDYLRAKRITPDAIVNFTDGYVGSWGQSDTPTLWAVTSNLRSPWGTTIQVEV